MLETLKKIKMITSELESESEEKIQRNYRERKVWKTGENMLKTWKIH